jgi:D-3-phosphoglycerate dehydrogenase
LISILNLEPKGYSSEAKAILSAVGKVENGPLSRVQLIHKIPKYDVMIVRLTHQIDKEIIDKAARLKLISSATTGLNHIDTEYAKENNIHVISLRGDTEFLEEIYATAEHTWALILALIRNIPQAVHSVKEGNWNRDLFKGSELNGKTLGIIGLGRIGKKVANYGLAFGMTVIAYSGDNSESTYGVQMTNSLKSLLEKSDVVSLHLPLNSSSYKMMGKDQFFSMKKGAVIINSSRGEITDEDALIDAIKTGHLSGAALDVITNETEIHNLKRSRIILFAKENGRLIITPHIGGATFESMEKTEIFMAEKLVYYFQGKFQKSKNKKIN